MNPRERNDPVLKTVWRKPHGFESHPLRHLAAHRRTTNRKGIPLRFLYSRVNFRSHIKRNTPKNYIAESAIIERSHSKSRRKQYDTPYTENRRSIERKQRGITFQAELRQILTSSQKRPGQSLSNTDIIH